MNIDIEKLRQDLINYYGTAIEYNPMAMMNLIEIEKASPTRVIEIAISNNIDLDDYQINVKRRML